MTTPTETRPEGSAAAVPHTPARIAVGVDGWPEGRDAAALGAALAAATGARLMFAAVHYAPLLATPGADWHALRGEAERALEEARDAHAPTARTIVETDWSVARALRRIVERERRDLLVVGSSRRATTGRVRVGRHSRQLLSELQCPLAIAPRGLHADPDFALRRIAVGYDGGPESAEALALAGAIAAAGGAQLRVIAVVDDRPPAVLRAYDLGGLITPEWTELLDSEERQLRKKAEAAAAITGATCSVETFRGRAADELLRVSREVDLLTVGSRRWGAIARVVLGTTGEALAHDAACALLATPRTRE